VVPEVIIYPEPPGGISPELHAPLHEKYSKSRLSKEKVETGVYK